MSVDIAKQMTRLQNDLKLKLYLSREIIGEEKERGREGEDYVRDWERAEEEMVEERGRKEILRKK